MKSLFLGLVFMITSLTGSTDVNNNTEVDDFVCNEWVHVMLGCGEEFFLCSDQYETSEELMEAVIYFSKDRC